MHLQGSFQGALVLDNCVRYRCNRPLLYLTEEHSIRWKFCLVNQKLFYLIWSASENQLVRTQRRRNPTFEDQRKLTTCRSVQKCTEESFSQCMVMYRKKLISETPKLSILQLRHRQGQRVTRPAVSRRGGSKTGLGRRRKSSLRHRSLVKLIGSLGITLSCQLKPHSLTHFKLQARFLGHNDD